jgi:AraC-like DNA-binding protein
LIPIVNAVRRSSATPPQSTWGNKAERLLRLAILRQMKSNGGGAFILRFLGGGLSVAGVAVSAILLEGRQRVGVPSGIPGILRDFGLDPESIVSRAGLDLDTLGDPESSIPFHALGVLVDICARATNCPHFGLLVGATGGTKSLGLVGELMRNAPTLGDAIVDLCTNQLRYVRGSTVYLVVEDRAALWGYGVHLPGTSAVDHISDGAMALGAKMFRELVHRQPEFARVSRSAPSDATPFRKILGVMPEFNAEQHALGFPSDWLTLPVVGADPQLRRKAQGEVDAFWQVLFPSFSERVARALRSRVIYGDVSLDAIAESLSLTGRTLNRRLQAEGRTFRQIVNEARLVVAQQLLAGTRTKVTSIGLALGYGDTSGFTRAFGSLAGLSPIEWRMKQWSGDAGNGRQRKND